MSKVMNLGFCVKEVIKPNISLHFSFTHNRPMAFVWEMIRQFKGTKLNLDVVGTGMLEYAIALTWAGHVKKMEGAFFGETYPAPRPTKLLTTLAREEKLELEYWTNLTIPERFMAAANGWDFAPTCSLRGSTLLEDHLKSGKALLFRDPVSNKEMIFIRSLQPDVAIIHGSVADAAGNTVITPPYGEDLWGVLAAKKVVVIVEKVVDQATIRTLSHLVKIPSHKVDYVVEVPFGAHPYGTSPIGYSKQAYGEDYEFRKEFSQAVRDEVDIDTFMKKWQLDQSHEAFLQQLGQKRLDQLKSSLTQQPGKKRILKKKATQTEKLIVAASRYIAGKIKAQNIETVLAGIGVSHLTAWLVYKRLKEEDISIQLMTETGYYGYEPVEGDPYIFNFGNLYTNSKQSSFVEILGQYVGDARHRCLAILSAAQIDQFGNLNSTKIPEKNLFLTGSGGANDIASVAGDVVGMMNGDSRKFVNEVPYITSPGEKVSTIFTNTAVLTRENADESFVVSQWIPNDFQSDLHYKTAISDLLPWKIDVCKEAKVMDEPTEQELEWLRAFDPHREFLS